MNRGGIKVSTKFRHNVRFVEGHSLRVSHAVLEGHAKLGIKISQQSMKSAPKRKNAPRYDTPTIGTFKSGKKKGQTRRFIKRGKFSRPGQPPRFRSGNRGRSLKNQKFAWTGSKTLVFGPIYFQSFGNDKNDRVIPNVHEFGGFVETAKVKSKFKKPKSKRKRSLAQGMKPKKNRLKKSNAPTVNVELQQRKLYPRRPFVGPAGDKAFQIIMKGRGTRIARKIR